MMSSQKIFLSCGLLAIAAVLHIYHVTYGADVDGQIFTFFEVHGALEQHVHSRMEDLEKRQIQDKSTNAVVDGAKAANETYEKTLAEIKEKVANGYKDRANQTNPSIPLDLLDANSYDPTGPSWDRAYAESKRDEQISAAKQEAWKIKSAGQSKIAMLSEMPVYFGMSPSVNIDGSASTRRKAGLWLGVVLPLSLLVVGGLLIIPAIPRKKGEQTPTSKEMSKPSSPARSGDGETNPIQALCHGGYGKRDDPYVIKDIRDYVAAEYAIAAFVMRSADQEFEFVEQSTGATDGRKIDQLLFDVKPEGASEWESRRRFFFDITTPYNKQYSR